ncbi:MAG: hypothetical protein WBF08_08625 [Candidatus Bathyarchaeia archaeon]
MQNRLHERLNNRVQRIKLTVLITLDGYGAIREIQQQYLRRTGKRQQLWKIVDAAIRTYAREQGIKVGE